MYFKAGTLEFHWGVRGFFLQMWLKTQIQPFPERCSLTAVGKDSFEIICYMAHHLYRRSKMAQTQGRGEGDSVWFNFLSIFWISFTRLEGTSKNPSAPSPKATSATFVLSDLVLCKPHLTPYIKDTTICQETCAEFQSPFHDLFIFLIVLNAQSLL